MIVSLGAYSLPILFAALGGYFTDVSGLLNIALEGMILLGAFVGFLVLEVTGSSLLALLLTLLVCMLASSALSLLTGYFKGNIFITALAANLLIPGLTSVISLRFFGTSGVLPLQEQRFLPLGTLVGLFSLLAVLLFSGSGYLMRRTRGGLLLRAAGSQPRALELRGGNPLLVRSAAYALSGLFCGLSGLFLTLTLHAYVPGVSSGKGWLALAAIYLGGRGRWGLLAAVLFFALAEAAANQMQGAFDLPASLFLGFPYLVTFLALGLRSFIASRKRNIR